MLEQEELTKNKNLYKSLLTNTNRANINKLLDWLEESDFYEAPASTRYHENYTGGLVLHSLKVLDVFKKLNEKFELNIDEKSLTLMSLVHDICKANCYIKSKKNVKVGQNWVTEDYFGFEDKNPIGHGHKSVIMLLEFGIPLSELEKYSIISHMGGYDKSDTFNPSNVFDKNDLSIWLHVADFIATYKDRSKV